MSAPSSSLPTPRQLLTSILNAIAEIPPPPPPPEVSTTRPDTLGEGGGRSIPLSTSDNNPLKRIDPSHRPLFTTLHVLFPSLLLPALDLLDRGLVTRLLHQKPHEQLPEHDGDVEMTEGSSSTLPLSTVYAVRSAQKPTGGSRRTDAATGGQTIYIVHTAVWNCTCAAFAFSAFPPAAADAASSVLSTLRRSGEGEVDEAAAGDFGGMSFDGTRVESDRGGGVPPYCKHLLACVLVERWAALGGYVNERSVGREDLAGIFAGI